MNALFLCVIVALFVSASAFSPLDPLNLEKIFLEKFNVRPERYPAAPEVVDKKPSTPVTKGKYYRSTPTPLGATNNDYMQIVAFRNTDCTGDVVGGAAYLLNYCWLYGYGDPVAMTSPYYVHFSVASNNTLSLNVKNTTNCSGPPLYRANNIVTEGCYGKNSLGIRGVQTMTPLWPQGQNGVSVKLHHNVKSCYNDNGFAYNFNTEYYMKMNSCVNMTTAGKTESFRINSCSGSANNYNGSYNINVFSSPDCTGSSTMKTIQSTAWCSSGMTTEWNEFGYLSTGCFDGPMHNKCYENFGISSTPCEAQLTQHALKFTCADPGYTGCEARLMMDNRKKTAEAFACCV